MAKTGERKGNTYIDLKNGTYAVLASNGKKAIIDASNVELCKPYTWSACKDLRTGAYYMKTTLPKDENGKRKMLPIHRLIMNVTERNQLIDHINFNTLDNRVANLRVCTHSESVRHRRTYYTNKSTGEKNITFSDGKYMVRVQTDHTRPTKRFGPDELDKAIAYRNYLLKEFHKEFGCEG